jgi:hypothetical protein
MSWPDAGFLAYSELVFEFIYLPWRLLLSLCQLAAGLLPINWCDVGTIEGSILVWLTTTGSAASFAPQPQPSLLT